MKGSLLGPGGFGALIFLLPKTFRSSRAIRGIITARDLGVEIASLRLAVVTSEALNTEKGDIGVC